MTDLLIHKKLRLLHKDDDKDLKIKPVTESPFGYAAHVNSIIISGPEFAESSKTYPIFFTKAVADRSADGSSSEEILQPLAIMGLENNTNLYVNDEGYWKPYCYIPAFFRRYPFIFQKDENNSLNLCIDEAYEGLNYEEGQALFDEDGNNSEYLNNLLAFLNDYEKSIHATEQFTKQLDDWELLDPVEFNITPPDTSEMPIKVGGLFQVNVKRFQQLEESKVVELHRQGLLSWINYHLNSLTNIQYLSQLFNNRKKAN